MHSSETENNVNSLSQSWKIIVTAFLIFFLFVDAEGLPFKKIEELAFLASDKVYGAEDSGPFEALRQSMGSCMASMNKVATAMQEGEYDLNRTSEKKVNEWNVESITQL